MFLYRYLTRYYIRLFRANPALFAVEWVILAFVPLMVSICFDNIIYKLVYVSNSYIDYFILILVPVFLITFAAFLAISMWVIFYGNLHTGKKLALIVMGYLLIWLSFGNIYYLLSNISNFIEIKEIMRSTMHLSEKNFILQDLDIKTIRGLMPFWQLNTDGSSLVRINHLGNYVDCIYFSGVNILTIGFGDFTPVDRIVKMLVLLEAFLGTAVNVLAVGIWLSGNTNENTQS